jgi:hypothetical protein
MSDTTETPTIPVGFYVDGRGRITELRAGGSEWEYPATTRQPCCGTYPPERLIRESEVVAREKAAVASALDKVIAHLEEYRVWQREREREDIDRARALGIDEAIATVKAARAAALADEGER